MSKDLWIVHIFVAANNLLSIKKLPLDQKIADCLVGGSETSWAAVGDSSIYTAHEMLLNNVIGALESHKVNLDGKILNKIQSASVRVHATKQVVT
ncbi:hypothetical protein VP01_2269g6 [Puccinia sorghi]|uniref:Uncharacterized protein n=1 Tax=Puccinia sorghi TaxID=27349 RepID=A0A0L6V8A4_9BASI|nr:hypothetical protein VP01_2269g6 [Puccinia sorghi]